MKNKIKDKSEPKYIKKKKEKTEKGNLVAMKNIVGRFRLYAHVRKGNLDFMPGKASGNM